MLSEWLRIFFAWESVLYSVHEFLIDPAFIAFIAFIASIATSPPLI
jgi:hypothetical protein